MNMLTYTTETLAQELNTNRNKIDLLRNAGIFKGIKKGKGYIFSEAHIQKQLALLTEMEADISTPQSIKLTKERMELWKKSTK